MLRKLIPHPLRRWRPIRQLWYTGRTYQCPICQRGYRQLLPFGIIERRNARCPGCNTLERHRLLWLYLKNKTDFFTAPLKVLDVAPTYRLQQKFRQLKNIDYLSIDLNSPTAMQKMDLTDLKLPTNSFDVIFCYHVLEHIQDDTKAMKELYRVLKPGGFSLLQVPVEMERATTYEDSTITDPKQREEHFGHSDHLRVYGRDYVKRLEKAGFKVEQNKFVSTFSKAEIKRFGLDGNGILFICSKTP